VTTTANTPNELLLLAIADAITAGLRIPCASCRKSDTSMAWVSDDRAEREQAARECDGCPVMQACAAAGEGEAFGVWGGVDRVAARLDRAREHQRLYRERNRRGEP
jgi:hypothetical protein